MLTSLRVRSADATPLKRRLFAAFQHLAERAELLKAKGEKPNLPLRLGLALGEFLVYGPVRDQLGLRRARWFYTGGAPLGPETFRFFRSLGVNLKQVWGATELSGLASLQPDGEADPETVGPSVLRLLQAGPGDPRGSDRGRMVSHRGFRVCRRARPSRRHRPR